MLSVTHGAKDERWRANIASKEVSSLKLTVHIFRGGPVVSQPFDRLENLQAVDGRNILCANDKIRFN